MKQKLLSLAFSILVSTTIFAQNNRHQTYLSNIVGIGSQDFGFIVGASPGHIFFITADKEDNAPGAGRYVRFYGEKGEHMSQYMTSFNFKDIHVRMYDVPITAKINWVSNSYNTNSAKLAPFRSFLADADDRKLNNWFASSAMFQINGESGPAVEMRSNQGNSFFRGMPIIDGNNAVIGLIADKQSYNTDAAVFTIISMEAIANKIYASTGCKNFQLIEYGQLNTRCDIKTAADKKSQDLIKKAKNDNSLHAFAIGPAFSVGFATLTTQGENGNAGGGTYALGFNLETWPDQGDFRVVLKPRINWVNFNIKGVTPKTAIGFETTKINLTNFEVPIMFEFLFSRSIGGNNYWGLGYIPGYQTKIGYSYKTTAKPDGQKATVAGTSLLTHKVTATIGTEIRHTRLELFASYQLSDWHRPTTYTIDNYQGNPFYGISNKYFIIGLDLSFRIGSPWGLKSVDAK